jgi:hypothetical protein
VRLDDGSVVESEVVVVGIGVAPNTGWLTDQGLNIDDGGRHDETLAAARAWSGAATSPDGGAPGTASSVRVVHWETAVADGPRRRRFRVLHRARRPPGGGCSIRCPWFWSDQYDRKIQLSGRSAIDDDVEVVIGSLEDRRFVAL